MRFFQCGVLLSIVLFLSSVAYSQMSLDDVIWLKKNNVSDQEILQEIQNGNIQYTLTKADVEKLRNAGFADDFIKKLGIWPFSDEVTLENVIVWVEEKKEEQEIIDRIENSQKTFAIGIPERLALRKRGVSDAIINALAESGKLTVNKIKKWSQQKLSEEELLQKIRKYKQYPTLSVMDLLSLRKAGISDRVIQELKAGSPKEIQPEKTPSAPVDKTPAVPADKTPAVPADKTPVVPTDKTPAVPADKIPPSDSMEMVPYDDITGLFGLSYPKDWRIMTEVKQNDSFRICFTPETQTAEIKDVKLGISVIAGLMEYGSSYDFMKIQDVYERYLPLLLQQNREYQYKEISHKLVKTGDMDTVWGEFTAIMNGVPVSENILLAYKNGVEFFFMFTCPTAQKDLYQAVLDKARDSLRLLPGRLSSKRTDIPISHTKIVPLAKEATVLVKTDFGNGMIGTGTGFFISPDGYIVTNHHVCYNHSDKMKQGQGFTISWDATIPRKPETVRLVAAWYGETPVHKDVALLKAEGVNYPYLPLASPEEILESDRVIAFGFPRTDVFGSEHITVTEGTIIRIVRNPENKLNKIFIDAKITHGNSGGPCFNLNLGGVMGINTLVYKGELLGYNVTLPITIALEEFAETYYPHRTSQISAADHLKLAVYCKGKRNYRAAGKELLKVTEMQSTNDLAWSLLGQVFMEESRNRDKKEEEMLIAEAIRYYEKALGINPKSEMSLYGLGDYYWSQGKVIECFQCYDKLVSFYPESVAAYNLRALLYANAKRYDEAIADAQKAINLSNDLHPDPYETLGYIYYGQKEYLKGKEQYEKAIKINPYKLSAHFQKIRYYVYDNNFAGAELEYGRLLDKFQGMPAVLEEIGNFYKEHKKDKSMALDYYQKAIALYDAKKVMPTLSLLRSTGTLAYEAQNYELALPMFNLRLYFEKGDFEKHDAMISIGNVFTKLKKSDIADAFYCLAFSTYPQDKELNDYMAKTQLTPLKMDSLDILIKNYSTTTIAQLILVADLAFTIPAEKLETLADKLSADILLALQLRAKNNWRPLRAGVNKNETPQPQREPTKPQQPGNYNHLINNVELQIQKFYNNGYNWYLDFTLANKNQVPIGDFVFNIVLLDATQQNVITTFTLNSSRSAKAGETITYANMFLVSYLKYSNVGYIRIQVKEIKSSQTQTNPPANMELPKTENSQGIMSGLKLEIQKFYCDDTAWYVDFSVANNNNVSVTGFVFDVILMDKEEKTVTTLNLNSQDIIPPSRTMNFTKASLVSSLVYPNLAYIRIQVKDVRAAN